jgi:hypothetical protein
MMGLPKALGVALIVPMITGDAVDVIKQTHQINKMYELLMEAKRGKVGTRTKRLKASLKNQMSEKEIHITILSNNKIGGLCDYVKKGKSDVMSVTLYRDFKARLRLAIDRDRAKKRQKPFWNDPKDL